MTDQRPSEKHLAMARIKECYSKDTEMGKLNRRTLNYFTMEHIDTLLAILAKHDTPPEGDFGEPIKELLNNLDYIYHQFHYGPLNKDEADKKVEKLLVNALAGRKEPDNES